MATTVPRAHLTPVDGGAFDAAYFERAPLRRSRELTTSTYRNLVFAWLARHWPELLCGTDRRALEVGCGFGWVTDALAAQGYDAVGVDISEHAIARAREESSARGATFAVWDATGPATFAAPFDLVVALEVLEHLADPDAALAAWADLLVPGGVLVCTTPNRHGPLSRYWRDPTHVSVRSDRAWGTSLLGTGAFEEVVVDAVQWVPGAWRLHGEFRFFALPAVGAQLRIFARRCGAAR